jgi:lipoyl(octanoyl) transferase
VADAKIASLGLKIKHGCCYHGLALNVSMDLSPFAAINPCGYAGMAVTQLAHFDPTADMETVGGRLLVQLQDKL